MLRSPALKARTSFMCDFKRRSSSGKNANCHTYCVTLVKQPCSGGNNHLYIQHDSKNDFLKLHIQLYTFRLGGLTLMSNLIQKAVSVQSRKDWSKSVVSVRSKQDCKFQTIFHWKTSKWMCNINAMTSKAIYKIIDNGQLQLPTSSKVMYELTLPMLLQLTWEETFSATIGTNIALVRMIESQMIPNLFTRNWRQTLGAKNLVWELRFRTVLRQEMAIQLQSRVEKLETNLLLLIAMKHFRWWNLFCGQFYKASTIVNYVSRVVPD